MRWKGLIPVWLLIVCPLGAFGQVHYVSHWGTHSPPYSTWETAATNLADAIQAAASGATIWVSNGIYRTGAASGGGLPARVRLTRSVALRSVNGARRTVIEGASNSDESPLGPLSVRGVYMTNALVDGFTVRRGHTAATGEVAATAGGGIYAVGGTQLNMRVVGNRGQAAGGAWLGRCWASNVTFEGNTSEVGAKVRTDRRVRMTACRIGTRSLPVPDLKILGTNGEVVVNGDAVMAAGTGVSFSGVPVGTGTATHVFTLVNWGDGTLDVEGVSFQGGDAGEFELVSAPSNAVVGPGEEQSLEIRFAPQAKGLRRTLLFVANDDPDDDPYGLWLEGEGLQAEMRVLGTNGGWIANGNTNPVVATGADFGLCVSEPVRRVFAITNAGTYGLGLTGTPFVVVQGALAGKVVKGDFAAFLDQGDAQVLDAVPDLRPELVIQAHAPEQDRQRYGQQNDDAHEAENTLSQGPLLPNLVSDVADGLDVLARRPQLSPKRLDVHVQGAAFAFEIIAPDAFQNAVAA